MKGKRERGNEGEKEMVFKRGGLFLWTWSILFHQLLS